MTVVIKSKYLLPQRAVIMISLCPTTLYGQKVSNIREINRSMAEVELQFVSIHRCASLLICFFTPLKSKTVHKACSKLNMREFYTTGIKELAM